MSAVIDFVEDVGGAVVDAVGDVVDVAVDVVEDVADAVGDTVEAALDDPIRTIATIAAIAAAPATGGASLNFIPAINAASTLANGGDFDDALKSAAISYVAQQAGAYVGDTLGTSIQYGTDLGSAQTAMLAQQSGDMIGNTLGGQIGNVAGAVTSGATAAGLSGGDMDQAMANALGSYLVRTGVRYGINEAGKLVDDLGNEAPPEVAQEIANEAQSQLPSGQPGVDNGDGTFTQTYDDGSTLTVDQNGNVVSSTTFDGETILPPTSEFGTDAYDVDNTGNISEDQILAGSNVDPYDVDNTGNISEENILAGANQDNILADVAGATGKYLQNQFSNALSQQIMGGLGLNQQASSRPGIRPRTSVGLPASMGVGQYLSSLGDFGQLPGDLLKPGPSTAEPSGPIELWNPGAMTWAPQQKLGGLGFSGRFINEETDQYANKESDENQKLLDEIRSRGWMTDEERAALEQQNQFYDPQYGGDLVDATSGMTPWLTPQYAEGGLADHNPEFYSEGGTSIANRYVKGDGDGTSDSVPAMLASGEFVIPADVVSGLGNGDNDAGAKVLDQFMQVIRQHKRSADPSELPPDSAGPLSYLSEAQKKVGKKNGRS